ncbi:MAG: long-chain fatty acid--CoA ligase, partial [Gammaproteobacteria bacterium]|nr:long-chain fatty acid--CoA ligase [Gammaproteobacteria bacterium]
RSGDGWVFTGDAGYFDDAGHLKIIDRVKDVGRINDGTLFAPKFLENKLKFFPQIREAVTFGDNQDHVSAFINIDLEAVGNWAERKNVAYASYQELAAHPEVYEMIRNCIEQTNTDIAKDSEIAGSQIKRFLILHKELDADDGELTRTRKVRRRIILERYGSLIDALYSDVSHGHIENEVTFEDGRKGMMIADLEIQNAQVFDHMKKAG